jgi:hypothetical protein
MSESICIDGEKSKKKKAITDRQANFRHFFHDYSKRSGLSNNTPEYIERIAQFYFRREDVVMRLITYLETYEP